jgi:Putative  PD-(D/E)XK family member, (DUF4420)
MTAPSRPVPSPIRMAVLSVEYGATYVLDDSGTRRELRTSVVRCHSDDQEIRELFASFCSSTLAALPAGPAEADLAAEIDKWLGLFWRLQSPTRIEVVGLIGELTVLMEAPDPGRWVRAWHSEPTSTIDFAFSGPRREIEVKATRSATRVHHLSADQAYGGTERYIASILVDLRESGDTIGEVAKHVADRLLSVDDIRRFWELLASECGEAFADFMQERCNWDVSRDSLAFFRVEDVPQPEVTYPLPVGVLGMTFISDFSGAPSIAPRDFFAQAELTPTQPK